MAVSFDTGIFSVIGINSELLVGAGLYWYATGTSTPLATYSDDGLSVPNTNPVVAGADGRFGPIYLQDAKYKMVLKTALGVTLVTRDPVSGETLAGPDGAGKVGFSQDETYPDDTMGRHGQITISVTDAPFNATGDGTTDDTTAIQAAITFAQATHAAVYLPRGNYKTTSALSITSPIKLYGDGNRASILKPNGSFDAINTTALSGTGLEIRDLGVINTLATNTATAGCGIRIQGASYANIENVQIDNCWRGIYASIFNFSRLTGVTVNGFVDTGFKLDGGFNSEFNTVTVSGNDTGMYCAYISEGNDKHLFINCNFSTGVYPLYITTTVYNTSARLEFSTFESCSFDSSAHGAFVEQCTAIVFDTCFFSNRPLNGCDVGTAKTTENITFINCDFFNCGVNGMEWGLFAEEMVAIGCKFVDNGTASPGTYDGLHINDGCSGWSVLACNFRNAWGGTGSQLHGLNIAGTNCNNFLVALNKFGPSVSQPFNNLSTADDQNIFGNLGYRTKASGTIALVSGAASVPLVVNFPAATYQLSFSCNANETIHWVPGSKAVDGFTINSSNGASTATVDWIAVLGDA